MDWRRGIRSAKVVAMCDERRLRELVLGAYNGDGRYVGAWAQVH